MSQILMKGIKNSSQGDYSYAHSVLQSLCCLESIKEFMSRPMNDIINNPKFLLTNAMYDLINCLINRKEGNSFNVLNSFINTYNNYSTLIPSRNVLNKDPFHFIFFLLHFLHIENNQPKNPNYNLNQQPSLQNQQNDDFMFTFFNNFFNETQNSIISGHFYTIERFQYNCPNCQTYYGYGMKNIIRMNIDYITNCRDYTTPQKKGTNITFNDCLNCYFGGVKKQCKNCNIYNIDRYTQLIIPGKVLIFYFERKSHPNRGDIDFDTKIDLSSYVCKSRTSNFNLYLNYNLKAFISYQNNKYYASCCFNLNNNKIWYRYLDDYVKPLESLKELYEFEPQLLIYELNYESNQQFNNNNNQFNYNNNQFNNFNQFNNNNQFDNNNQFNNNNNQFNNNQFNMNQFNNNQINKNIFNQLYYN